MIEIKQLNKKFANYYALRNINLSIPKGKLIALLGPSGCGKTTLLRIIAGLETADSGQIFFEQQELTKLPVQQRNIGFMFQNYALFRHMTVFDNIAFGLSVLPRKIRPNKATIKHKVQELLKLIQLHWIGQAYPDQLSGGQKQRVALARCLAVEPKLLLLDEPFGALDAKVRKDLRQWLKDIQQELGITCILVTHDQEEAIEIADQIAVMNYGEIQQSGTSDNLYFKPNSPYITEFLGEVNSFSNAKLQNSTLKIANFETTDFTLAGSNPQEPLLAYVRPHDLILSSSQPNNFIDKAQVTNISLTGNYVRVILEQSKQNKITAVLSHQEFQQQNIKIADWLYFYPQKVTCFPESKLIEYAI